MITCDSCGEVGNARTVDLDIGLPTNLLPTVTLSCELCINCYEKWLLQIVYTAKQRLNHCDISGRCADQVKQKLEKIGTHTYDDGSKIPF